MPINRLPTFPYIPSLCCSVFGPLGADALHPIINTRGDQEYFHIGDLYIVQAYIAEKCSSIVAIGVNITN